MRCKMYFPYVAALLMLLPISQDGVSQTSTPASDEVTLVKYPIVFTNLIDRSGDGCVWDLSRNEVVDQPITQTINVVHDSIPLIYSSERGMLSCFQKVREGILEKGYENNMVRMTYERRPLQVMLPLKRGDVFRGLYSAIGTYCDKVKMRVFGTFETRTAGTGIIILPNGDTLRNATCVTCEKSESVLFYPRYVDLKSWYFTQDSILKHYVDSALPYTLTERVFLFVRGIPYPVITYAYSSSPGPNIRQGFYYPPEEQPSSASLLTEVVPGDCFDESPAPESYHDIGFKYKFTADAATHKVVVDYTCESPCSVSVLLCDAYGVLYRQQERHGDTAGEISIDYGSLEKGQYVVLIKCGMDSYAEKFNHQ